MVGWFILKRLPLVGRHLVGITIGVGHQAANAWMMQTVYEAYSFYRDQDYLREKIYPMLRETVRFWNAFT